MGRRKEGGGTRKKHMVSARLTEEEWQKLRKLCAVSGLPVSALLRELICGVTIRQRPPKELHDLYTEINRIGTNINQIARKANAGGVRRGGMGRSAHLGRAGRRKKTGLPTG